MPASGLLRDLGVAGFVAVVGLQCGLRAVETIRNNGISKELIDKAVQRNSNEHYPADNVDVLFQHSRVSFFG